MPSTGLSSSRETPCKAFCFCTSSSCSWRAASRRCFSFYHISTLHRCVIIAGSCGCRKPSGRKTQVAPGGSHQEGKKEGILVGHDRTCVIYLPKAHGSHASQSGYFLWILPVILWTRSRFCGHLMLSLCKINSRLGKSYRQYKYNIHLYSYIFIYGAGDPDTFRDCFLESWCYPI